MRIPIIKGKTNFEPNWQLNFRTLPEIPIYKRWDNKNPENRYTPEQEISYKLLSGIQISEEEKQAFTELSNFYYTLNVELKKLEYSSFTPTDFENFKNYILYAFNYQAVVNNSLTIFHTYRLVVNEFASNKNERIHNIKYLKHPDLELVKKINKYNRANTPNSNIFYSTDCMDSALKEIRPPINKLITFGIWKPKTTKNTFISYPISHIDEAYDVNDGVAKSTRVFEDKLKNNELLQNYMRFYLQLLGREYSKPVNHHYEYLISAFFSERIFDLRKIASPEWRYDCIIYPSVGNKYKTDNIALFPDVIENEFKLERVVEMEIEESFYDNDYELNYPNQITLAKTKNINTTTNIDEKGNIFW